ncbi:hypothetical protein MHU86_4108 [Fragilaria crotonensis]|nr:hypothetical protein MHU86_4108 [Fragilaria crotonensis]
MGITNARDLAYLAVDKALSDPTFVVLFEQCGVLAFSSLRAGEHSFVAADDPTKSDTVGAENESRSLTVKITIAISSVVFIVAGSPKEVRKKSRLDRRRYFQSLNGDDGIVAGPVVQLNSEQDGRSLIWSDITSDSGSVTSILSRTTAGRLQKIDEEPDHERHAEVEAKWDVQTPLSTQYTIAYSAHASRLQELVRKACSDEHDDDVETTIPQISTLTTEASFPTSFATDDDPLVPIEVHRTPPAYRSENSANLSSLSDFHTPHSDTSQDGFSQEQGEHPPLGSFPSYESIWSDAPATPTILVNDDPDVLDGRRSGIAMNRSVDTTDSDASLQRWLAQLLLELHLSQQMKRIEL